jgi:hypothetical protein
MQSYPIEESQEADKKLTTLFLKPFQSTANQVKLGKETIT